MPQQHQSAMLTKNLVKMDVAQQRREALVFIANFAEQNALQLNGRYSIDSHTTRDLYLFPNQVSLTRRTIYEQYFNACQLLHWEPISFALWNELWNLKFPQCMTSNNRKEICHECRNYQQLIANGSSTNDSAKLLSSKLYLNHLSFVQNETAHYRTLVERCLQCYEQINQKADFESSIREKIISSLSSMHYSFDWYSTISLPFTSDSSFYFRSGYKVALFGISIEPMKKHVLYILPEFICHQKDTIINITISLIHHFLTNIQLNVKEVFIHFANGALEQAKNILILCYFLWRILFGNAWLGINFFTNP